MNINKNKIIQSIVFLILGIFLFWLIYKDINLTEIETALSNLNYIWIVLAVIIGLISHIIRAIRWKMLIKPMGYNASVKNLYISVLILYFTNLIIPRGGEAVRCGIISKYEKIPFTKLLGTVIIERLSDFLVFLLILIPVVLWQNNYMQQLMNLPELNFSSENFATNIIKIAIFLFVIVVLFFVFMKTEIYKKIKNKIIGIKNDIIEGVTTIIYLKKRVKYIMYSLSIFALWLLMFYFMFFAYQPTSKLSFAIALFTYSVASLAYMLPIQAGIGAWHFIVIQSLLLFGIDPEQGMIFALIAHTFISMIYLFFGAIAFILLPIINR